MAINLYLDLSQVLQGMEEFDTAIKAEIDDAAKKLSIMADAHIKEQAQSKLHSRREAFLDKLSWSQIGQGLYAITVNEEALWIEEGMPPHNMLEDLLASPKAKTSKDGHRYVIVPFKHSKGNSRLTPQQRELKGAVLNHLRENKIPYGKIEKHPDGSPKIGLLHKFNLSQPDRLHTVHPGLQGPSGQHFQAHEVPTGQAGAGGRPYLWGTSIYQSFKKDKDGKQVSRRDGSPAVERGIFTFRIASDSQRGKNAWNHPGLSPMHFLDEAFEWAKREWENNIIPKILEEVGAK